MDRDDGHPANVFVDVEAVREELRFAGINELHDPSDAGSELFDRNFSDIGTVDVDDRF
jgi:hypothetical protein